MCDTEMVAVHLHIGILVILFKSTFLLLHVPLYYGSIILNCMYKQICIFHEFHFRQVKWDYKIVFEKEVTEKDLSEPVILITLVSIQI